MRKFPNPVHPAARMRNTPSIAGVPGGGGVYRIRCIEAHAAYIGATWDFPRRWIEHQQLLLTGTHVNRRLQRAFNYYGRSEFVFEVLEYFYGKDKDQLYLAEHRQMQLHRGHLYNVRPAGDDDFIRRFSHLLKK